VKLGQVSAVCTAAEGAARLAVDIARSLSHAEGRRHAGSTRTSAQNFVTATADKPNRSSPATKCCSAELQHGTLQRRRAPVAARAAPRGAAGRAASQLDKEQRLARHAGQLRRLYHRLDHALVLRAAPRRPSAPGQRRSPCAH